MEEPEKKEGLANPYQSGLLMESGSSDWDFIEMKYDRNKKATKLYDTDLKQLNIYLP